MPQEKKTISDLEIATRQSGVVKNAVNQLKLILRLLGDRRVNFFAKLIPIGALVYLVWPIDPANIALPLIGPLDDAALLWLGSYVFTELCPPEVVEEHMKQIYGVGSAADEEIIDAETVETKDENQP